MGIVYLMYELIIVTNIVLIYVNSKKDGTHIVLDADPIGADLCGLVASCLYSSI